MRYLKIYENYFLEKDKIDISSKKLDEELTQEVLDLIPDISLIDGFKYSKSVKTNVLENELYEFEFRIFFQKKTIVGDYKNMIISELYRLNSILSQSYNIKYSIDFRIFRGEQGINLIQREKFNTIEFKEIKEIIESIEEKHNVMKNDKLPEFHGHMDNDRVSFFGIKIHILRS